MFSLDSTGQGQAAVLNQDNSINGPSNPATRGSVIQIFATGEGQTSPPGVTGSLTRSTPPLPVLPVKVTIAGLDAPLQFAGSAPDSVAGLMQVNALVPQGVTPGQTATASAAKGANVGRFLFVSQATRHIVPPNNARQLAWPDRDWIQPTTDLG
jgi:uncharacterized protein (TIGR03437 family)